MWEERCDVQTLHHAIAAVQTVQSALVTCEDSRRPVHRGGRGNHVGAIARPAEMLVVCRLPRGGSSRHLAAVRARLAGCVLRFESTDCPCNSCATLAPAVVVMAQQHVLRALLRATNLPKVHLLLHRALYRVTVLGPREVDGW